MQRAATSPAKVFAGDYAHSRLLGLLSGFSGLT